MRPSLLQAGIAAAEGLGIAGAALLARGSAGLSAAAGRSADAVAREAAELRPEVQTALNQIGLGIRCCWPVSSLCAAAVTCMRTLCCAQDAWIGAQPTVWPYIVQVQYAERHLGVQAASYPAQQWLYAALTSGKFLSLLSLELRWPNRSCLIGD